jgi:murein DD-endopeptidase MepM/ murein hydrolase activator NlpD
LNAGKGKFQAPARASRKGLAPIARDYRSIELDTAFLEQPAHHRWLLTTCIVGTAATLLLGGITLGLFGRNAAPPEANAAISPTEVTGKKLQDKLSSNFSTASIPETKIDALPERNLNEGWSYPEVKESELPYNEGNTAVLDAEIGQVESEKNNITELSKSPPPEPVDETFKLAKGESLIEELTNRGVSQAAAEALIKSVEHVLPTKTIKAGTSFEVTFDRQIDFYGREVIFPVELSFRPSPKQLVSVSADEDGNFLASLEGKAEAPTPTAKPVVVAATDYRTRTRIGASLYSTAKDNRIPDYIVAEFARVFSYDVDFQNQIKPTDDFDLFFGKPLGGSSSKRKVLHFARLNYGGKTKTYFRYTSSDGQTDYYDETGRSASRALLKTPVSGVKITSGFGYRKHPLLRYSKMHEGVDFGAPTGTPIRAAGSGTIDIAGRHGGFGNTIVIQHNTRFKTLYAHMSRFAAGITAGKHVNQGQIIGYVGTTGRSTGPHLHFEVRVADRPVNPLNVRATGGKQLAGKDMTNFRVNQKKILALMQAAPASTQIAQAGQ